MRLKTVFDMDNTLIPNEYYANAKDEFSELIERKLGFPRQKIIDMHTEIDRENLKKNGFHEERFASSMVQVYETLCSNLGILADDCVKKESYELGMSVFDEEAWRRNDLLPGVEETLEFLLAKGYSIYLLSEGAVKKQKRKIEVTSLNKWFNEDNKNYLCVNEKKPVHLLALINDEKSNSCYVGDKITRDVSLALNAGVKPIYIPRENAKDSAFFGEPSEDVLDTEKVVKLKSIIDLKIDYYKIFSS